VSYNNPVFASEYPTFEDPLYFDKGKDDRVSAKAIGNDGSYYF